MRWMSRLDSDRGSSEGKTDNPETRTIFVNSLGLSPAKPTIFTLGATVSEHLSRFDQITDYSY